MNREENVNIVALSHKGNDRMEWFGLKNIKEFVRAAHICSNQCFNAHQEFKHEKSYYENAYKDFDKAWSKIPRWLRKLFIT